MSNLILITVLVLHSDLHTHLLVRRHTQVCRLLLLLLQLCRVQILNEKGVLNRSSLFVASASMAEVANAMRVPHSLASFIATAGKIRAWTCMLEAQVEGLLGTITQQHITRVVSMVLFLPFHLLVVFLSRFCNLRFV